MVRLNKNLTILSEFAPASGPAGCGVVELTGATCQADRSDVVSEVDRAAELHQGNVVVQVRIVVVRVDKDLRHTLFHLMSVRPSLSLSPKVERPCTQ